MMKQAAVAVVLLLANIIPSAAQPEGEPNTDVRRAWCEARLKNCQAIASKPGFLGGALNYCNNPSERAGCLSICEKRWGRSSKCLTRLNPNGGAPN